METRLAALRAHLLTFLASVALSGLLVWQRAAPPATALRILPAPTPPPTPPTAAAPEWQVHVTGAVAAPGLVRLSPGARVADAVEAAGGLSPEADGDAINLAAALADGLQLHVPALGEAPPSALGAAPGASGSAMAGTAGGIAPAFGAPMPGSDPAAGPDGVAGHPSAGAAGAAVDLNTAGTAELESLPGVGPALAARILAQRQSRGPFRSVQDLLEVPGIGAKTLARFADKLVVR